MNKKHLSFCTIAMFSVLNNSGYLHVLNLRFVRNLRILDSTVCLKNTVNRSYCEILLQYKITVFYLIHVFV